MQSRHSGRELFLFELIRELFPGDEDRGARDTPQPVADPVLFMTLTAVLFLLYGLLFGVLSRP